MTQSFADYRALEGVNWSTLKYMAESPKAYKWRLDHPVADTPAMLLGRATHTAVLEPDRLPIDYAVYTGARRSGSEWKEFKAVNRDRDILKQSEYQTCLNIRDAVYSHQCAARELSGGCSEISIEWLDGSTGIKCKGRLDYHRQGTLIDLKTTATFGERFVTTAARLGYHRQMSWYRQGMHRVDCEIDEVLMIVVQSVPPYDVMLYRLPDELLDYAWTEVRDLLERLRKCQRKDEWPGAAPHVVDLELPLWAFPDEEPLVLTRGGESFGL